MRYVALFVIALFFSGCGSLNTMFNSEPTKNASTNDMKKCCGCPGMEQCNTKKDDPLCCKEDDCKCKEVTKR